MSDSNEVATDPRLEKRTRRRFSIAERKHLLAEADALPYGEKGSWLEKTGHPASAPEHLSRILRSEGLGSSAKNFQEWRFWQVKCKQVLFWLL